MSSAPLFAVRGTVVVVQIAVPAGFRAAYLNEEMPTATGYLQSPLSDLSVCTSLP